MNDQETQAMDALKVENKKLHSTINEARSHIFDLHTQLENMSEGLANTRKELEEARASVEKMQLIRREERKPVTRKDLFVFAYLLGKLFHGEGFTNKNITTRVKKLIAEIDKEDQNDLE